MMAPASTSTSREPRPSCAGSSAAPDRGVGYRATNGIVVGDADAPCASPSRWCSAATRKQFACSSAARPVLGGRRPESPASPGPSWCRRSAGGSGEVVITSAGRSSGRWWCSPCGPCLGRPRWTASGSSSIRRLNPWSPRRSGRPPPHRHRAGRPPRGPGRGVRGRGRLLLSGLQRLLPTTVDPGDLQPANALRGLTFSLANVAGPVVAGALIAFTGGPGARSPSTPPPSRCRSPCWCRCGHGHRGRGGLRPAAGWEASFGTALREGGHEVRSRSWVLGYLGGFSVYQRSCCPRTSSSGRC